MATPFTSDRPVAPPPTHRERTAGALAALFAAAGVVLAIIGLAGAARFFDGIVEIVLGAAFLLAVWSVVFAGDHSAGDHHEHEQHAGGIWVERLAGWVGIVFGILALLHLAPLFLAPIAVIVFGAGLAFAVGLLSRTGHVVVGCAAMVLGILALLQLHPRTLTLIGLLAVSGMLLLTGPVVASRGHIHPRAHAT